MPRLLGTEWSDNFDNEALNDKRFFNFQYGAGLSYALTRKLSLAVHYNRFNRALTLENGRGLGATVVNGEIEVNLYDYDYDFDLSVQTFSLGIKWARFKRGGLSPFGPYFGLYLNRHMADGMRTGQRYSGSGFNANHEYIDLEYDFEAAYWDIDLEFGVNYIFLDRIVLTTAFQLGLGLPSETYLDFNINSVEELMAFNRTRFDNQTEQEIFAHQLLLVKFGLGYLIF
ncbi:MAG: hypothetical protein GYB31_00725 [Bacteroidetes bacterium]|nr:hypothetical protein [Bacteroidota bacterium]